ncbi:MAG: hypothetical protein RBU21_24605, partial [FCB group bacterium]|nr:hypothetical protein [FCB group bacterium]
EDIDEWASYEYNASSKEWICRDGNNPYFSGRHSALQPDGHYSEGHNVLRPDGKIEFVKEAPPR